MKTPTYTRAHKLILDYILQFCTNMTLYDQSLGRKRQIGASVGFYPLDGEERKTLCPGDLILVKSAAAGKWRLSWFIESDRPAGWIEDRYALASIEDREECWWSNIGITRFDPEEIKLHDNWRWNDEQFEFNDKWFKACKQEDAYIYLPVSVRFVAGFQAEIGVRSRWGLTEYRPTRMIEDYRKVTYKTLRALYLEMVEETKSQEKKK